MSISCGVHPLYVEDSQTPVNDVGKRLRELAQQPSVVAIGETGSDYFYHPESKNCNSNILPSTFRWRKNLINR